MFNIMKKFGKKTKQEKAIEFVPEKEKQEKTAELVPEDGTWIPGGIKRDFYCNIFFTQYKSVEKEGRSLDDVSYSVNGRIYTGMDSFEKEEIESLPDILAKKSEPCKVAAYRDIYGNAVLRLSVSIPTFDIGDREFDSVHFLYLFHDQEQIYGAYCMAGYVLAKIILCSNLNYVDDKLKPWLEKFGFPLKV